MATAARITGRLRIALSRVPYFAVRCGKAERRPSTRRSALLRDLGHDVVVAIPDYPGFDLCNYLPRFSAVSKATT